MASRRRNLGKKRVYERKGMKEPETAVNRVYRACTTEGGDVVAITGKREELGTRNHK